MSERQARGCFHAHTPVRSSVSTIAGKSGKYFMAQQHSTADLNGYIEEMINGQRVVKIFCHEEKAKDAFDGKNSCSSSSVKIRSAPAIAIATALSCCDT